MSTNTERQSDRSELLTPRIAAEYLGLKPRTLANARCRGDGPKFTRVFGRIRYRRSELDAWLAGRTFRSTGEAADTELG
ncbi:MAG TPA: helix-turn-helix domain-containing protein [Gemmatimonas sp.]|uniref:helix-turn-helix transcriptional regulator n=1 Tax=Gemmatimonas sp. TaxID=1962908 RepID=UPI002EDAFEAD